MSFMVGLMEGLNDARAKELERNQAEQARQQELEFNILSQLATGPDDQIAALAGAGLLERLNGKSKIHQAKGLAGFFGQAERSSFLPQIQAIIGQRGGMPPAPASPGGAALPGASPIEPKAQGPGASQPPMLEMPLVSRQGLGVAPVPEMPMVSRQGLGVEMPAVAQAGLGVAGGASAALGGAPVPPPPPETAQMRYRRLFPDAAEVAAQSKARELMTRFTTAIQAMRSAQNPEEKAMIAGMSGAPLPQLRPSAVNVRYIDEMGVETSGVGVLGADGQVEIDGRPVRAIQVTPINQRSRAPQSVDVAGPDGNLVRKFYDPDTMQEVNSVPRNLPPQYPSQTEGPMVPMSDGSYAVRPRNAPPGAPPVKIPGSKVPERAGSTRVPDPKKSERARRAAAYSKDVKAAIKEAAGKDLVTNIPKSLDTRRKDDITKQITKGAFQSYDELIQAEQGLEGGGPPPATPGAFGTPEGAAAIEAQLRKRRQQQ